MSKDLLFLLPPGFEDNDRREFCPECAELWGVLHYYPAIKEALDIRYVGIHHPRRLHNVIQFHAQVLQPAEGETARQMHIVVNDQRRVL